MRPTEPDLELYTENIMTDVVMPQMGESIVEGTLTKWLKKPGDHVDRDEPLFEISTDKVDTEIPSPTAGTLKEVLVEEGKTVGDQYRGGPHRRRRGHGGRGTAPAAASSRCACTPRHPPQPAAPQAQPAPQPSRPSPAQLHPSARPRPTRPRNPRRLRSRTRRSAVAAGPQDGAREQHRSEPGKGTGAGGRITKQDLEAYMSAQGARTMAQPRATRRGRATPAAPRRPQLRRALRLHAPVRPAPKPRAPASNP